MPGGFGTPYRPPCGGWPAAPKLYLGCGNHVIAAHKTIPRYINTTLAPSDPCEPQTWAFPNPRPANEDAGSGFEHVPQCVSGSPEGAWPEPIPENTYALPQEGESQVWDASQCNKIGFKNVIAEKQWHGALELACQEANGGARYAAMNGDGTCPTREEAGALPPANRYLAMAVYAKHKYRTVNATYPDGDETIQTYSSSWSVDKDSGKSTGSKSRSVVHDEVDALVTEFFGYTPDRVIEIYGDWHGTIPGGVADSYTDGASPSFSWADASSFPGGISQPSSNNSESIEGACSFTDTASVTITHDRSSVVTSSPSYGYSNTTNRETIRLNFTPQKLTYVRVVSSSVADDPDAIGNTAETLEETWEFSVTLSAPYTHTQLHADVNELLATWNLGDDAQYPWRFQIDNAYDKIFTELNSNNIGTSGGPFVTRNERGPVSPGLWPDDIPDPDNPGDFIPYVDESLPARADYPDGGIIGAPLPTGYEYYFDFKHVDYRFEFDLSATSILGIPRNYGAISPWRHATQWLTNQECRWFPTGPWTSYKGIRNPEAYTTDGSPILIPRTGLIKSKWAEIHHRRYPSHNYFRPCGSDVRATWGADYRPICGRITITSATQSGGNVDIVLSEAAPGLITGDSVDFTSVPGLGTGLSVTVTDSTHFSVAGTLTTSPTLGGYVSSNGAPSYGWNDDKRKGDFVYRVFNNDFRDFLESWRQRWEAAAAVDNGCSMDAGSPVRHTIVTPDTDERNDIGTGTYWLKEVVCSQECLPFGGCNPAVIYVSPNVETGHANSITLAHPGAGEIPDEGFGSFWCSQIQQAMPDPLGGSDLVEARFDEPSGAPDYPAGATPLVCEDGTQQYDFTLEYWADDDPGGNSYRIFGQPNTAYPFSHV